MESSVCSFRARRLLHRRDVVDAVDLVDVVFGALSAVVVLSLPLLFVLVFASVIVVV